jgi:hypothetical protein
MTVADWQRQAAHNLEACGLAPAKARRFAELAANAPPPIHPDSYLEGIIAALAPPKRVSEHATP